MVRQSYVVETRLARDGDDCEGMQTSGWLLVPELDHSVSSGLARSLLKQSSSTPTAIPLL
jgi:hypothetical protein